MSRLASTFKALKKTNKKAFIAFITAGYPSLQVTEKLILEFEKIGVDIVELGVPFSDPMADGPVIQEASSYALSKKVHLQDILKLVKRVRNKTSLPICLMTYYNPVFCFPQRKFIEKAASSGVDGVIIPDLPPEEAKDFIKYAHKKNLDTIFFISPTTSLERIKFISKVSRGFIYYVSLTGVTGARSSIPADLVSRIKQVKKYTNKPLCVGFGVSNRAQVARIKATADGVIVGSAIVKKIKDNMDDPKLTTKTANFIKGLI